MLLLGALITSAKDSLLPLAQEVAARGDALPGFESRRNRQSLSRVRLLAAG